MKACPFCGSTDVRVFTNAGFGGFQPRPDLTMAICTECNASGPVVRTRFDPSAQGVDEPTQQLAVLRWDHRT